MPQVVKVGETPLDLVWQWGDMSLAPGSTGIRVADWDGDGVNETLVGHEQYVFALRHRGNYQFSQMWAAPMGVTWGLANLDEDSTQEVWVIQPDGRLLAYDPFTFTPRLVGAISVPTSGPPMGRPLVAAEIADLLGSGQPELLVPINTGSASYLRTYSLPALRETWSYTLDRPNTAYHRAGLVVAQVDDDASLEIILDNGVVIDRARSIEQWFSGGFGSRMVAADLDRDGRDELITNVNGITIFDIDLRAASYRLAGDYRSIEALYAADVTDDGVPDVIAGEDQWGKLYVFDGATRQTLWTINLGNHGTCGLGVGDADSDGELDLVWCSGASYSGPDHLYLTPISRHDPTLILPDLDGPYHGIPMQLDDDAALELVILIWGAEPSSLSHYLVVDSATGLEEPGLALDVTPVSRDSSVATPGWLLVNIDTDPHQELIFGRGNDLYVLDHNGHLLLTRSFSASVTPVWAGDLDGDGAAELVTFGYNRVNIHRLDTLEYTWQSDAFSVPIQNVAVADLDADGGLDLLFHGYNSYLQAYDARTHQLKWQGPTSQRVNALAVGNVDATGPLEIVVVENGYLTFYDAPTHSFLRRTVQVPSSPTRNSLRLDYMTGTRYPQLLVGFHEGLWLFAHPYDMRPLQTFPVNPASVALTDTDDDGHRDLLVGHTLGVSRYRFRAAHAERVPPTVQAVAPAPGIGSVARNAFAAMVFSEPVAPQTITHQTVQLRVAGAALPVTPTYDADRRVLRLTPQSLLPPNSVVTVWVTRDVQDMSGNGLDRNLNGVGGEPEDDFTWSFMTGADSDDLPPSVRDLALWPNPGSTGRPVTLMATAADASPAGVASTIYQAEYFLDEPGEPGSGRPVLAVDGRFDTAEEGLTATLDTTGWSGQRRVYVRAEDSAGHWSQPLVITLTLQTELPANWPMFGHDPAHSGYNGAQRSLRRATRVWERDLWTTLGATLTTPRTQVAVANGIVVANVDSRYGKGGILALDARDGHELWRRTLEEKFSINPPSIEYGQVYFQQGNHMNDSFLFALNAQTGAEAWRAPFMAQSEMFLPPTVAEGKVFINAGDSGGMYGFDAFDGQQLWFVRLRADRQWTPAYSRGVLYSWVAGALGAWNPRQGAQLWSVNTGENWITETMERVASVGGDTAYVTTPIGGGSWPLIAIDLATQREKWRVSGTFLGTPAVADNEVYALDETVLRAFNRVTGELLWSYAASERLVGAPVVTQGEVFVASSQHTWGIDRTSHQVVFTAAKGGWLTVANDQLYIAQPDGVLTTYAVPQP